MLDAGQVLQETIAAAAPLIGSRQYKGVISQASRKMAQAIVQQQQKRSIGRPTKYNKKLADEICKRVENAETIPSIAKALGIELVSIYDWLDRYPEFSERYNRSKRLMAKTMVENLVDEVSTLQNDQALAARVKSDLVKWVATRYAPEDFSDTKRIQLSGEVTHKHVHELATEQKQRIAESWLMSQQAEDTPGITAETTGPDIKALESDGVREICETEQRELPKRKRTATQKPGTGKGKPGRKPKLNLDQPVDQPS